MFGESGAQQELKMECLKCVSQTAKCCSFFNKLQSYESKDDTWCARRYSSKCDFSHVHCYVGTFPPVRVSLVFFCSLFFSEKAQRNTFKLYADSNCW